MSYGLRKRVELARAIALKPEVILLDEPMAGMNLEEKEDMARYIDDLNEELGMTVVMIEHDMGVVMDLSHRLMVLDFGRKIAEGVPDEIKINEDVKRAYLGQDHGALGAPKAEEAGMIPSQFAHIEANDTLPKLLRYNARHHGGDIVLREKELGLWRHVHLGRLTTNAPSCGRIALHKLGVGPGDAVAIIGDSRPGLGRGGRRHARRHGR